MPKQPLSPEEQAELQELEELHSLESKYGQESSPVVDSMMNTPYLQQVKEQTDEAFSPDSIGRTLAGGVAAPSLPIDKLKSLISGSDAAKVLTSDATKTAADAILPHVPGIGKAYSMAKAAYKLIPSLKTVLNGSTIASEAPEASTPLAEAIKASISQPGASQTISKPIFDPFTKKVR